MLQVEIIYGCSGYLYYSQGMSQNLKAYSHTSRMKHTQPLMKIFALFRQHFLAIVQQHRLILLTYVVVTEPVFLTIPLPGMLELLHQHAMFLFRMWS